jgi:hypothetical protein
VGGATLAPQIRVGADGQIELVEESLTVTAQQREVDSFQQANDEVGSCFPLPRGASGRQCRARRGE